MGDLAIRVQPRAKRTEVAGERGGAIGAKEPRKHVRVDGLSAAQVRQTLLG
jgi:hypothetical protein